MDEEIVDVVDGDNKVLSQVSKSEAHQKGLLHRTVIAEIIDSDGKMTLVNQASDRQDAGQYVSPVGGHAKAGETEEETLKREAFEEAGLKDFQYKRIGQVTYDRNVLGRQENHYFILYEIFSDDPITLNEESVEYKAFTENELKSEIKQNPQKFGGAFYVILENFYPHLLEGKT
jgi:isopentenyl-diphosphate delta-isomerase